MKLNTTKLLIAALALCGTCFLSCEKEEFPFEKVLADENIEIETEIGSFEAAFNIKFNEYSKDNLIECGIKISDSTQVDKYSIAERKSKNGQLSCRFSGLNPNTTYYYSLFVDVKSDGKSEQYGETKSFTTAKADLLTCYKASYGPRRILITGTKLDYTPISNKKEKDKFTLYMYFSDRGSVLSDDSIPIIDSTYWFFIDNKEVTNLDVMTHASSDYNHESSVYGVYRLTIELNEDCEIDSIIYRNLTPFTQYYARAVLANDKEFKYMGNLIGLVTTDYKYEASPVDLGLSVMWADRNLGSDCIEDNGAYFAWGELMPKKSYTWETYMCKKDECGTENDPIYIDLGDTVSITGNPKFDAATDKLGKGWRMPTENEVYELVNKCRYEKYTKEDGTKGLLFIAPNNNKIFIPYVGYYSSNEIIYNHRMITFWYSNKQGTEANALTMFYPYQFQFEQPARCLGATIRPVYVGENE